MQNFNKMDLLKTFSKKKFNELKFCCHFMQNFLINITIIRFIHVNQTRIKV